MNYYYLDHTNAPQGPLNLAQLETLHRQGIITPDTLVAANGDASWKPYREYMGAYPPLVEISGTCPNCHRPISFGDEQCDACGRVFLPLKRNPWGYFLQCLKLYATFTGRATRAEFWSYMLITGLIQGLLAHFTGTDSIITYLAGMALLCPDLSVTWRRLHDIGRPGWFFFMILIPGLGALCLLVLMLFDSKSGSNQYGPATKYP